MKEFLCGVVTGLLVAGVAAGAEPARSDQPLPSAGFRQAIARTEARLFASAYSRSSPRAGERTREAVAGLVSAAWHLADRMAMLHAPALVVNREMIGRPGLFNPDNRYRNALLDPAGSYRISGGRGTHGHFTIQILDAFPLLALGRNLRVLGDEELRLKPGDTFELYLGGPRREGRWWPLPPEARSILVRETFGDWVTETPSELSIERLDHPATPANATAPSRFDRAAEYLDQMTELWAGTYLKQVEQLPVNTLSPPRKSQGGLEGQYSVMGRFRLTPDQALIITVRASDAAYQAIQLGDPWFVTPDWVRHQCSLNLRQARIDGDGKVRFVISVQDPGVPNWLDPDDNAEGYIFMRWQGLPRPLTEADTPRAQLVPRVELREHLPPDTLVIDRAARARQLAQRRFAPVLR